MSENKQAEQKAERSLDQVNREYSQLCTQAGHIQYQIFNYEKDLAQINDTLRALNLEGAGIQKKAQEKAAMETELKAKLEAAKKEGDRPEPGKPLEVKPALEAVKKEG